MNNEELRSINEELSLDRSENDYPWIVFSLDKKEYGINSKYVLSIEILGDITPIVDAPHYCPGIADFRGDMIDLLDLRSLFGLGSYDMVMSQKHDGQYMMVVLEIGSKKRGIIVDEIVSVEYITQFVDGLVGDTGGGIRSRYVQRVARRERLDTPVLILSPDSLME